MSKRRTIIMEELDPQSVEGFTEAQKRYYASIGYKPYLNAEDKIVWLSPELHGLRIYAKHRRPLLKRFFLNNKRIQKPLRRRHRSLFEKFIKHNWLLMLIMISIMAFVLIYIRYYI